MAATETWIRGNRRAVLVGLATCAVPLAIGGWLLWLGLGGPSWWSIIAGGALLAGGVILVTLLVFELLRPRLAYCDGYLLAYLSPGSPYRVPIGIVECFLLGQGLSMLPGKHNHDRRTSTVAIRLAERATDWQHRNTLPALGGWCGGQITIRGTWCEPISLDLVNRLNARLAEVQRGPHAARVAP